MMWFKRHYKLPFILKCKSVQYFTIAIDSYFKNTDAPGLMMGLHPDQPIVHWKYCQVENASKTPNIPNIVAYLTLP